jgi:hypothetical protein
VQGSRDVATQKACHQAEVTDCLYSILNAGIGKKVDLKREEITFYYCPILGIINSGRHGVAGWEQGDEHLF